MMDEPKTQRCAICGKEGEYSARYPRYVCLECAARVVDDSGRALTFENEAVSGGFIARYADTLEIRDSHECWIDGVKCWADEAHMGGIVIRVA